MAVLFVAGSYGVGKSTIAEMLSKRMSIPCYSASDLISRENGEQYTINKSVHDKSQNQIILLRAVREIVSDNPDIILVGHFCIFSKNKKVDFLPDFVYSKMNIKLILLMYASAEQISKNLTRRGGNDYSIEQIKQLITLEDNACKIISKKYNYPFRKYQMRYDGFDIDRIVPLIKNSCIWI